MNEDPVYKRLSLCCHTSKRNITQLSGAVEYTNCLYCRVVIPHLLNECPGYDSKQSDGGVPVMQGLWGMQSTLSLPSLPCSLWLGVVAPDRVQSMGKI